MLTGWGARIRTSEWRNQNLDVLLLDILDVLDSVAKRGAKRSYTPD